MVVGVAEVLPQELFGFSRAESEMEGGMAPQR